MIIKNEKINDIPLLHVVNEEGRLQKLPLIIFIHGFSSLKERNLHYAYLLADAGFRVILPEAVYHGEREQGLSETQLFARFWEIVITMIEELNIVKEYYDKKGLVAEGEIGVAGTSMGGIATLGALTQYPWIKAAVSLMGMPSYEKFSHWQLEQLKKQGAELPFSEEQINEQLEAISKYDLSIQPYKLSNRPLLFWHGKKDPMVPYSLAHEFFESIRDGYVENKEKLEFIADPLAGHSVSVEGVNATVEWFKKFLKNRPSQDSRNKKVGVSDHE